MRLYRKEKQWHDFWELHINFPWVGKRFAPTGIELSGLEYGFSFPTECCLYAENGNYWTFTLRILGFGTTIVRQNGY